MYWNQHILLLLEDIKVSLLLLWKQTWNFHTSFVEEDTKSCDIWSSHTGVAVDSSLLGCEAVLLGK